MIEIKNCWKSHFYCISIFISVRQLCRTSFFFLVRGSLLDKQQNKKIWIFLGWWTFWSRYAIGVSSGFFFQSLPTMRQKSEKDLLVARNEIAHSFDSHFMNIHAIRNIPFVVFIIIGEVYFEFRIWPPSEPKLFMKGMKSGKCNLRS